jgi:hypothetical protein
VCEAYLRMTVLRDGQRVGEVPLTCERDVGHLGEHMCVYTFPDQSVVQLVWGVDGGDDAREVRAAFLSSLPLIGGVYEPDPGEAGEAAEPDGSLEGSGEGEERLHDGDQGPDQESEGAD